MRTNDWQRIPGLFNKEEIEQIKEPGKEYYQEPRGRDSWSREIFALYYRPTGREVSRWL